MFKSFLQDDSGAQVIEYALIIAVISIALVVALTPLVTDGTFSNFVALVAGCLDGSGC
jgi:pilus assembly protein Flp/PilA